MTAIQRVCALAMIGAWGVGCSSSDNGAPDDAGEDVVVTTVDSGSGDASTSAQTVGPSGGTVSAPGIDLTIPAGALASNTTISITPNAGTIPAGYVGLSPLYAFAPDGTVFLKPITVNFALTGLGANPTVFWSNASGGYDPLATTVTAGAASAQVSHFSTGFVAVGQAPDDGGIDGTVTLDATVADAPTGDDAIAPGDSSTGSDDSSSANETGAGTDASTADASSTDASTADAGASDAAVADAGGVDAADAGLDGITVTVDGVATVFASSPSATYANLISTIQANDNASTTHWQIQIVVMYGAPEQVACSTSTEYPSMKYTHFTAGVADQTFSTAYQTAICDLIVTHVAQATGQATTGMISGATLYPAADAGTTSHMFVNGTFNVTM